MSPSSFLRRRALRARPAARTLLGIAAAMLLVAAGTAIIGASSVRPAVASTGSPTACDRVIDGVEWTLDPCVNEGDPVPPDLADVLAQLQACPTATPPASGPAPASGTAAARRGAVTGPSGGPVGSNPPSAPPPPSSAPPSSIPPPSVTPSPPGPSSPAPSSPSPSSPSPSASGPQCPVLDDPHPWPGFPPPGSPSPQPSDSGGPSGGPSESPSPVPTESQPVSPSPSGTRESCATASATASGMAARDDAPKDESADLIHCRKPADPKKPGITLVGAGNSLVSAHHQTGFGVGTCDNTTFDNVRKLVGNDADFSFVGRYYAANNQIAEYYNFARTGFSTDDIMKAAAAKKDACNNPWNRNDTPVNLAVKVVKAAKAKGNDAYFIADGGVNNTNWTSVVSALAQCNGLDFTVNNLLAGAGNVGVKVKFYYVVPKVDATDPPLGLKKNIIKVGGSCFATVQIGGPFPQTWWTRVAVPAYDGPGSPNPSALSKQIKPDIAAAIAALLGAGADKIVWMLYYNMNPANVDVANLGLAWCRVQCPAWLSRFLPGNVTALDVALIEAAFAGDVNKMTTDLNNEVKAGIPANAKVKAMTPPVFTSADIQNTAIGGCPHPSDAGHNKLAGTLSATFAGM